MDGTRAILLRSAGDDFSCGGDVTPWPGMEGAELLRGKFEGYISAFNRRERFPLPVISTVRGLY